MLLRNELKINDEKKLRLKEAVKEQYKIVKLESCTQGVKKNHTHVVNNLH